MFYEQANARLLAQKRFELSEILHYGVRVQPQRYHLRLRFIAPDRLSAERDDLPNIGIQVGDVTCHGPRRWHCQHATFPSMDATVHAFVLPEPPLTHVTFKVTETPTTEVITIGAEGDPWQCPPFAVTCFTPSFDETAFQARSRYAGTLIVDRRTGLPRSLSDAGLQRMLLERRRLALRPVQRGARMRRGDAATRGQFTAGRGVWLYRPAIRHGEQMETIGPDVALGPHDDLSVNTGLRFFR